MGPSPRNFAVDANYCIMVRILGSNRIQVRGAMNRSARRVPLGTFGSRFRQSTGRHRLTLAVKRRLPVDRPRASKTWKQKRERSHRNQPLTSKSPYKQLPPICRDFAGHCNYAYSLAYRWRRIWRIFGEFSRQLRRYLRGPCLCDDCAGLSLFFIGDFHLWRRTERRSHSPRSGRVVTASPAAGLALIF